MSWLDNFRNTVSIDRDAYTEMLHEAQGLRDDKKRLQVQIDDLAKELKAMREDYVTLAREKKQTPVITKEMIAQRMHLPLSLVDQIDFERLGMQVKEER